MFTKKKLPAVNLLFLASSSLKTPPPHKFFEAYFEMKQYFFEKMIILHIGIFMRSEKKGHIYQLGILLKITKNGHIANGHVP